jgi:hypothetical protein
LKVGRRFSDPVRRESGWANLKQRRTVVEKPYHLVGKESSGELGRYLAQKGQFLLPMVGLIEQSKMAVDELIDVLGRAQVEAALRLSAERIAGPPHPGKKGGVIGWHGREEGTVCLKERKLRVKRPRLRRKGQGEDGEVPIPAYEAMRSEEKLGSRMLEILLRGGFDAAVSGGAPGNGGNGGGLAVERESRSHRGEGNGSSGNLCVNGRPLRERMKAPSKLHGLGHVD